MQFGLNWLLSVTSRRATDLESGITGNDHRLRSRGLIFSYDENFTVPTNIRSLGSVSGRCSVLA